MHRSERDRAGTCSACGGEVKGNVDRTFAFGSRGLLCFECAIERGGSYEERREIWVEEPLVDDLGRFYE
jgi:hypothetical protein